MQKRFECTAHECRPINSESWHQRVTSHKTLFPEAADDATKNVVPRHSLANSSDFIHHEVNVFNQHFFFNVERLLLAVRWGNRPVREADVKMCVDFGGGILETLVDVLILYHVSCCGILSCGNVPLCTQCGNVYDYVHGISVWTRFRDTAWPAPVISSNPRVYGMS